MKKTAVKELTSTFLLLVGVFAFRSTFAEAYVVPTGSMIPTILPGDRLFVSKMAYNLKIPFTDISLARLHEPERGDVIVFKYPIDPSINYVKRLIGVPGDEIQVTDGEISVNGKRLDLIADATDTKLYRETIEGTGGSTRHEIQRLPHMKSATPQKFKVPKDHYFFMGDNRDNSNDSRFWGFVPASYIKGKAMRVWLSLDWDRGTLPEVRWNRFGNNL